MLLCLTISTAFGGGGGSELLHRLCTAILVISPKLRTSADIWREKINGS